MGKKTDLDGYDAKTRRMMKGMAAAEDRALASRSEEECECKDGMFPSMDRRGFLTGAAAAGAAGAAVLATRGAVAAPPGWRGRAPMPMEAIDVITASASPGYLPTIPAALPWKTMM